MDFCKLLELTKENNAMLKRLVDRLDEVTSDEYVTKQQMRDFINNVIADLFADMMLQPKGRGHNLSKQDIVDIINQMKV